MNKNTSKKSIVSSKNNYDLDLLQNMYKKMLLIRRFEEKAGQLYGMGKIGGFCHLYIGQEAVVVGVQSVQIEGDSVVTSYRDHGHMLACDMDPKGVMAELTGREDGYSKGKGGSMHMFSREKGFFGGHGIVAAQVPIGAGLAFAHKYNGNKNVAITYFGDGAANQGQVYESYNIAALWKLPVIFVIENNKYGMGTSVNRSSAGDNLSDRGKAYGIVAAQVPIGAGLAFAHKYNGNKNVAITYFGDGAANQGQVYESYNIAALWKLPVIFVIENNKYGMGTSVNRSSAGDNLSDRGKAYGIVADIVDGMDVIAVRDAALKAMDYCRSGKGPYILEMKTYRYRGHSMSDPAKYRTRDEVDEIRQNSDPINNIKSILDKFGLKDENLKIIDTEIKSIIANAATFAQESPEPSEAELFTDITIN
jgi:pyruvate dehydrogenase E1 component alpha subunit